MNNVTSNIELAKFLGWFLEEDGLPGSWFKLIDNGKYVIYSQYKDQYGELPFHKDIKYLFEIIDKIESLGYDVIIGGGAVSIKVTSVSPKFYESCILYRDRSFSRVDGIYEVVVKFVEFYNTNIIQ